MNEGRPGKLVSDRGRRNTDGLTPGDRDRSLRVGRLSGLFGVSGSSVAIFLLRLLHAAASSLAAVALPALLLAAGAIPTTHLGVRGGMALPERSSPWHFGAFLLLSGAFFLIRTNFRDALYG